MFNKEWKIIIYFLFYWPVRKGNYIVKVDLEICTANTAGNDMIPNVAAREKASCLSVFIDIFPFQCVTVSWGACWFLVEVWALWVILRDQSPTSMKLCPDAGATLEETRSSSEQVTGETVSYSVCEGPGSVLKSRGCFHGLVTLQRHTAGPWRLCSQSVVLTSATQTCFYSEHIIHWFILWGFSLEVHMFVAGLLLCVWGSRFITEGYR